MKVDIYITEALDKYCVQHRITQKQFARQLNVSEATMVKWRRQGTGISDIRWKSLFKLIRPYLPSDRIYLASNGEECYSSLNETVGKYNYFSPKFIPALIPVLTASDLLKYNSFVQSIEQFAADHALPRVEYRPRIQSAGGLFAYQTTEEQEHIPAGATLYASTEARPKQNQITIAVTKDKRIVVGKYSASANTFKIGSLHGSLDEISSILSGIFPVIVYEVVCA
jgi:transcriptional regulator with XRE-family HTH domain